jgi:hypothetical protein
MSRPPAALADFPPPNSNAAGTGGAGARMQSRKRARERGEAIGGLGWVGLIPRPPFFPACAAPCPSLAGVVVLRLLVGGLVVLCRLLSGALSFMASRNPQPQWLSLSQSSLLRGARLGWLASVELAVLCSLYKWQHGHGRQGNEWCSAGRLCR